MTRLERQSERILAEMSERKWQNTVVSLAQDRGYLVSHVHRSDRALCAAGFPDLVIAGHKRLVIAEIKTLHGKLTEAQEGWRKVLQYIEYYDYQIWRPGDLGEVNKLLPPEVSK